MNQGTIHERATRMTLDIVEGRKKRQVLTGLAAPRVKVRDLELNRYRELLEHPNLACIFTIKD